MAAEWLSGHIDRGDDARDVYSYSLEGQNELLQFLKAIRPEWSFPKKNGKSNLRSVMDKLKAVRVGTVWELFRAVMRNTISEDLAQAGYSVLSKETLDRIRKRTSFFRQLDVLTETDCRQTGAFAPVPQLLSQKKLAYWSKVPSHHGRKFDERPQSPERRSPTPRASSSQSRRASRSGHFENRLFVSNGNLIEVDGQDMCRPRLRGARTCVRRGHDIEPFRAEKSEADTSQALDKDRWALKSAMRLPALSKTWQAGDNKATCSSSLDSGDKPPKIGLLREASQVSISGDDSHTLRDGSTENRTRLGSGQSSFLFMTPQQRARSSSVDHSSSGQEADTLLATVVKLQQEAAAMQDFRPPSWSVLRRHENALIESGQAMLDEQKALFERSKLQKLMEQEGLCSPMRQHVAKNVRSRLKEESEKVAAEGLEMQHKCTNIRKNLGQMMNARRDLASLRRAIVGRGIDEEQLKRDLLTS